MRIDKFLANHAFGSRKEVHAMIKSKRVTINGALCLKKDENFDELQDIVCVDGNEVTYQEFYYIKLHKPTGYVTAVQDSLHPTVMDLLPEKYVKLGVFPVGRLDKDTEGLLLLTNDGQWAHRIINGTKAVDKLYVATIEGILAMDAVEQAAKGILLKDGTACKPAKLKVRAPQEVELIIQEGKYHQVKRMIAALGAAVVELKRLSIGSITLEGIEKKGTFSYLSPEEVDKF